MVWIKLDDRMADHPKLLGLGEDYEAGMAVFVAGLCFCGGNLTDGVIPKVKAHTLTPGAQRIAPRLVEAGLWHDEGPCYRVHDFLEYNPSREEMRKKREGTRRRVNDWRRKTCNAVTDDASNSSPDPDPEPEPEPKDQDIWSSRGDDRAFERFWIHYPRKQKKQDARRAWTEALERASAEEIISVVKWYPFDLSEDKQFVPLPARWLREERWTDEVEPL